MECAHIIVRQLSLVTIVILFAFLLIMKPSEAAADNSALLKLISGNDDEQVSVRDLAFFLVTHDFDATPHKDHVVVEMGHSVYKVVPNGRFAGLANITEQS